MEDKVSKEDVQRQLNEKQKEIRERADAIEREAGSLSADTQDYAQLSKKVLGYGALAGGSLLALLLMSRASSSEAAPSRSSATGTLVGLGLTAAAGIGLDYAARQLTGSSLIEWARQQLDISMEGYSAQEKNYPPIHNTAGAEVPDADTKAPPSSSNASPSPESLRSEEEPPA